MLTKEQDTLQAADLILCKWKAAHHAACIEDLAGEAFEVQDDVRGRTFAFVQSLIRVVLVGVLAVAPLIAAAVELAQHVFVWNFTVFKHQFAGI